MPKCDTLPHDPVAAANSIAELFEVVPPDAALNVAATRA
jgi:hypothetical protein